MKLVAVIPARGGSKGLPNKNLLQLNGKELITWSIDFALALKVFDDIIVTSDSDNILSAANKNGVTTIKRPAELAQDDSPTSSAILHALEGYTDDTTVVLLQPTTPFRTKESFEKALSLFKTTNKPCVYVTKPSHSVFSSFTSKDGELSPLFSMEQAQKRRQEQDEVFQLTGGLYITKLEWLKKFKSFITPLPCFVETFSIENIDIDTKEDFDYAQFLAEKKEIL